MQRIRLLAWAPSIVAIAFALTALALQLSRGMPVPQVVESIMLTVAFGGMAVVGSLIASRQPRNAVGWLFMATPFSTALGIAADEYARVAFVRNPGSLPAAEWAAWLSDWTWGVALSLPFTFLLMLFPDGRLPSRRWRPFAVATGLFIAFVVAVFAFGPATYPYYRGVVVRNPVAIDAFRPLVAFVDGPGIYGLFVIVLASLASLILRYRWSDRVVRQRIKWFAYAAAVSAGTLIVSFLLEPLGLEGGFLGTALPFVAFTALPVGVGVAILRHRLFDIDLVIRRTLVVALLVAFITALYVGIVVGIGALVGTRGNLLLSIVATALIALAFQPAREWARRFANRLVYGKRATPYEVMSEFAEGAAGMYSIDEVLPRMAEIVAAGTGATKAAVWLSVGDELRLEAAHPADAQWPASAAIRDDVLAVRGADACVPVRHRGETLGAITVAMPAAEPLRPTHEQLLADVASQAGLVLRNVRLIEDLRASRQRLVAAQDEERRRLERNIHDGAQQQLVALAVKMRLVEAMARKDPEKAAELATQAKGELQEALDDLRDLARGIYPPLLADQGLAAALEAQARKAAVPVEVHPDGVGRYPQEVEAGAYFCVLEALQNAAKYADASRVEISLRQADGQLVFEVRDDGRGFDPATTPPGSGLTNMRDRLDALGGSVDVESSPGDGTTVRGRVPVPRGTP